MKQALVTLNFAVIAVLVTIVAMQSRVDARPKSAAIGGPIPGLLESEIPVERQFSFVFGWTNAATGPSISPDFWPNTVQFHEMQLPANVGLVVTEFLPFRNPNYSFEITGPVAAFYVNGVPAVFSPAGAASSEVGHRSFFVSPGATIRIEMQGTSGVTLRGAYLAASELVLP